MKALFRWAAVLAALLTTALAMAAPHPGLQVRLSTASPVLQGDVDVLVTVSVTNTTRHPVNVLRWQLPSDEMDTSLFRITREDGQAVRYTGMLAKRSAPEATDFVRLEGGATVEYQVELTEMYDLARSGRYAIQYAARNTHARQPFSLSSDTLYLWLEGRTGKGATAPAPAPMAGTTSYTGCSTTQQTQLSQAVTQAISYASGAVSHLNGLNSGSARYTKWFGAYTSARKNEVLQNFQKVEAAFSTQNLAFDCKCKKRGTFAYVYANQPYKIYLCGAFWSAPLAGTDSRGGTLIHEMTHFTVVAGTSDYAYGQTNAATLATNNPDQAVDNADNHEYFAENTPAL